MTIRNLSQTATTCIVQEVEQKAFSFVDSFCHAVRNFDPADTVRQYSSWINDLNKQWKLSVKHHIRYGRQLQSIYVDGCNRYSMEKFIMDRYSFKLHHGKQFRRIDYTFDKFFDMAKMEVAFLLAKYEEVYKFEISVAVISMLLRYFNVYNLNGWNDGKMWVISADDIYRCINDLDEIDMQVIKFYADKIGEFVPTVKQHPSVRKTKPTCKEDIERCIDDDMTQTEFVESVMENWNVSRASAYRLLAKFGFTKHKKTKSLAERPVIAATSTDDINSIDDLRTLRGIILQQRFEIAELKEEIEQLKSR